MEKPQSGNLGNYQWWLFYVDESNTIQNLYSVTDETDWKKGNVGAKKYQAPDETQFTFTVRKGIEFNRAKNELAGGLSLYASDWKGVVHEYIYDEQDGSWMDNQKLPKWTPSLVPVPSG